MARKRVLIIDDEPDIRELLEITVMRMGFETACADSVESALNALEGSNFDLCLTDMKLPDGDGLEIVEHVQRHHSGTPIAMITAFGSTEAAVEALKAGAFDFVSKPVDLERLRQLVANALKLVDRDSCDHEVDEAKLQGQAPVVKALRQQVAKLARSQAPVYISGESGSGKEVVARLIHANGSRASAPFVPVNCGAIPTELMESEFFGHLKGSFSGAIDHKIGLFEAANGGTLFLDEVADLPLNMQVKLLRAIQEKAIRKVGSNEEVSIDIRILSATHKDLAELVERELFRNDLYYRINVIELKVPPLRERKEDIPLLTQNMLKKLSEQWQIPLPTLSPEAASSLQNYDFPGNVRELENILERALTLCESNSIKSPDLQLNKQSGAAEVFPPKINSDKKEEPPTTVESGISYRLEDYPSLDAYLEAIEKEALKEALEKTRWNKTAAAERLGISFRQMRYRLKKLELE